MNTMLSLGKITLLTGTILTITIPAIASTGSGSTLDQVKAYDQRASLSQINSVSQLRDASPSDWAFSALQNLVEKYNCIAGYPNGTYRGNRPLSRYEFAAGLNACLQSIERMIASVDTSDIDSLRRLVNEFEAELASLGARVDDLEGRVEFLEDNQFSTTTKLVGEVAFNIANAFGDQNADGEEFDSQVVFQDKTRLQLATSFTGKDRLYTRLTAGSIGNSFANQIGTNEGRFAFDGPSGNNVIIDRLHYVFPIGDNTTVTTMASLGAHHFYADTFNAGLEAGGGANGALSRFGERNPIYRLGISRGTTGLGIKHDFSDALQFSVGYLAKNGSEPTEENGLFDGTYSAMAQLAIKPSDSFKFGLNYVRGYDTGAGTFAYGGTGTDWANGLGGAAGGIESNSFGLQTQWDVSDQVSLRGWLGYTHADFVNVDAEADIWTWAGILAFPDFGKKGNMAAVIVGSEPYASDLQIGGATPVNFTNDMPLHIEGLYKHQLTKNLSLTPGFIWLLNPNQNEGNEDIFISTLRTTFRF